MIVAALRDQVLQLRTLPSVPTLLTGCRNMRSDLSWRDYLNLATSLQALNSSRVSFAAIDDKMVIDTVVSTGAAVLLPRWDPIRALVAESFGPARSIPPSERAPPPSTSPLGPSPSPLLPAESVAGPWRIESLPGDPPVYSVPATPQARGPDRATSCE